MAALDNSSKPIVYLAGNVRPTRTDFRMSVYYMAEVEGLDIKILDPRLLQDPTIPYGSYSPDDVRSIALTERNMIERADIIVAHIDDEAGGRYGTVMELAYASALGGKILIVWNERDDISLTSSWARDFLQAHCFTNSWEVAQDFLESVVHSW